MSVSVHTRSFCLYGFHVTEDKIQTWSHVQAWQRSRICLAHQPLHSGCSRQPGFAMGHSHSRCVPNLSPLHVLFSLPLVFFLFIIVTLATHLKLLWTSNRKKSANYQHVTPGQQVIAFHPSMRTEIFCLVHCDILVPATYLAQVCSINICSMKEQTNETV